MYFGIFNIIKLHHISVLKTAITVLPKTHHHPTNCILDQNRIRQVIFKSAIKRFV